MLLTTAIIALSRKVSDDKARRREAKQGLLQKGDEELARRAFDPTTGNEPASGSTDIRFFQPADVASGNDISGERGDNQELESSRPLSVQSHDTAGTQRADIQRLDETLDQMDIRSSIASGSDDPPPYSPMAPSSITASPIGPTNSRHSEDTTRGEGDARSCSSGNATIMTGPDGVRGIRVRTKGSDLKSGFPYQPELFDLHIRPDVWDRFTAQVIASTKFGFGDNAQMIAAATATALTGAVVTSVLVGRTVYRSLQENKVRNGLHDMSDGGLGDVLKKWNESEFRALGLFAHVELSRSAIKRKEQGSHGIRKPSLLYSKREDRERKQEERKFCIVVTKLDDEGVPMDDLQDIAAETAVVEAPVAGAEVSEAPNSENVIYEISELPGDMGHPTAEPSAAELEDEKKKEKNDFGLPQGYAELESPLSYGATTWSSIDEITENSPDSDESLRPEPLMVTAATHAALNKETS